MIRLCLYCLLSFLSLSCLIAQNLPEARRTDWHKAGYPDRLPEYGQLVNINDFGGNGNGTTPNDLALSEAVASLNGQPGTLYFPEGVYLFQHRIVLRDSLVLKGAGADATQLHFNSGGTSIDCILASGSLAPETQAVFLSAGFAQGDTLLHLPQGATFKAGEVLKLTFDDSLVVFSDWARGLAGQIFEVTEVLPDGALRCSHPMRLDVPLDWRPRLRRVSPINDAGVECLKIKRLDPNVPFGVNISFQYARRCWVLGVESEDCHFAHLTFDASIHCEAYGNYFHHAFAYGGGGQGYGVVCQATSSDNRVQNNVFKHLRHSILLQSGANGNVLGYNFSTDPYWENIPIDGGGELVIHGNYPSFNLFEGNVVNNIRPDGSHGLNGPNNTFLRNRTQGYGFITTGEQSYLNALGHEIISNGPLQGLFLVGGTNNYLYNNNVQGSINPAGTTEMVDSSYYLSGTPRFLAGQHYLIGAPAPVGSGKLPAEMRFYDNNPTDCDARDGLSVSQQEVAMPQMPAWKAVPNPFADFLEIQANADHWRLEVFDQYGRSVKQQQVDSPSVQVDTHTWPNGLYWVRVGGSGRLVLKH